MAVVNLAVLKRSKWRERQKEDFAASVAQVFEPFTLEDLYPEREVETPPNSGKWEKIQQVLPHQTVFHNKTTPDGKKARLLLFNGGVGCTGGNTILNGVPVGDLAHNGVVSTLFGSMRSTQVYRKGQAELWKVTLRSGRQCVVTAHHRFLTLSGWRRLEALAVGDLIASDGNENDNCCWETPKGYQQNCLPYSRSCGELPTPAEVAFRETLRKSFGLGTSHTYKEFLSLSTGGFSRLSVPNHREDAFGYRDGSDGAVSLRGQRQDFGQSGLWTHPQSSGGLCPPLEVCSGGSSPSRYGFRDSEEFQKYLPESCQVRQPQPFVSQDAQRLPRSSQESVSVSYSSSDYYNTSFWDEIQDIQYHSFGDFFDLTVPGAGHYSAEGIWHKNSGKTTSACVEVLYLLRKHPGLKVVCIAPFDYFFDETVLPTWRLILDEDSPLVKTVNIKTRTWTLNNGSEIRFKAYDDPDKIKGWQCHVLWFEECGVLGNGNNFIAASIFNAACERMREPGRQYPRLVIATQNPAGHNWSWKKWIKPNPLGDFGKVTRLPASDMYPNGMAYSEFWHTTPSGDTYYCISTGTSANALLPPGYLETMLDNRADDPAMRARMIEGSFAPIHSLIYDYDSCGYAPASHFVPLQAVLQRYELDHTEEQDIPRHWPLLVGIDCAGKASPWAIECYAETPDGEWLAVHEIYVKGKTWDEIARLIRDFTDGPLLDPHDNIHGRRDITAAWDNVEYFIDPQSSRQAQGPDLQTIERVFHELGIPVQQPYRPSKDAAISVVKRFLKPDTRSPHPFLEDEYDEQKGQYKLGKSALYYLTKPELVSDDNPYGVLCVCNTKEKEVYRVDGSKQREGKDHEEGLSAFRPEKILDRDDHAQTAEMFAFVGKFPLQRARIHSKKDLRDPEVPYQAQARRRF